MRRGMLVAVLTAFLTTSLSSCHREQTTLRHVVINEAFEHLLYIGLYVAKDKGFFAMQGLDVRIDTGGGDAQAFAALTSGSAQFAQGDPGFVAIAAEKGWQGKVVGMAVDRAAMWGVTYKKSIKPSQDSHVFRNMTVGTYPDPNTSYVIQKQLDEQAGLTLGKDTKILQLPFGTELSALQSNRADIVHTIEPNVSQVEAQGGTVVFSYAKAYGPLAFTGLMTSKKLIDEDPQLVQKFLNAYERALRYIQSDPAGALAVARKRLPNLPPAVIEAGLKRLIDSESIPKHAAVNPESWRKLLQIRVDVGDLKKMPAEQLYDNSFADAAEQEMQSK